jgi:ubiquinone/menaquinone biosynthesis C-methylase UbiE
MRNDEIWKTDSVVRTFLDGVRGGIPLAAEQIDVMLRVIEARGRAVESFIDLGCGSGTLAASILARYPEARAALVDFSQPMIGEARQHLKAHAARCRFAVADLGSAEWQLSVRDSSPFDVAVSGYAIHHLPDERKRELYREIFELLAPGGFFVNIEHVASRTGWLESISDDLFVDSLFTFHSRKGSGKTRVQVADEFVRRPDKAANILASVESQCEWLREIGYEDVDCYFKIFELAVFGGRRPQRESS